MSNHLCNDKQNPPPCKRKTVHLLVLRHSQLFNNHMNNTKHRSCSERQPCIPGRFNNGDMCKLNAYKISPPLLRLFLPPLFPPFLPPLLLLLSCLSYTAPSHSTSEHRFTTLSNSEQSHFLVFFFYFFIFFCSFVAKALARMANVFRTHQD